MRRSILLLSIVLSLSTVPRPAQAQFEGAALASQPVKSILDYAQQKLDQSIHTLGEESRHSIFVAGQQAQLTIQNFRLAGNDVLNTAFKDLGKAEQKTLQDVLFVAETLSKKMDVQTKSLDETAQRLENAIYALPLAKTTPRIISFSPVYYAAVLPGAPAVPLHIRGSLLGAGDPVLWLNGQKFTPQTKTDRELLFLVPNKLFSNAGTAVGYRTLDITVYEEVYRYLVPNKLVPHNFKMLVFRLPQQAASFDVTAIRRVKSDRREPRKSYTLEVRAPHCQSSESCVAVTATPGWMIETNPPPVWKEHHSDGGSMNGFRDLSAAGFCVNLRADSYGCKEALGITIDKGTQGHISGEVSYFEYQKDVETEDRPVVVSGQKLVWGKDYSIMLPEHSEGFIVKLKMYDGRELVFDRPTNEGLLTITFNEMSRLLIVRPNDPDQILR